MSGKNKTNIWDFLIKLIDSMQFFGKGLNKDFRSNLVIDIFLFLVVFVILYFCIPIVLTIKAPYIEFFATLIVCLAIYHLIKTIYECKATFVRKPSAIK